MINRVLTVIDQGVGCHVTLIRQRHPANEGGVKELSFYSFTVKEFRRQEEEDRQHHPRGFKAAQ